MTHKEEFFMKFTCKDNGVCKFDIVPHHVWTWIEQKLAEKELEITRLKDPYVNVFSDGYTKGIQKAISIIHLLDDNAPLGISSYSIRQIISGLTAGATKG